MPRRKVMITLALILSALLIIALYIYKNSTAAKLANYRNLLEKNPKNYFTYKPNTVHKFNNFEIDIGPGGYRKNAILDEEILRNPDFLKRDSYNIAVFGSWMAASLGVNTHASLSSYLNTMAHTVFAKEPLLFYDYAIGGNNLEMTTALIEQALQDQKFDAALIFIEPKDLIYDVDYFNDHKNLTLKKVFNENNWIKTQALLKKLRGEINTKFNVDIIPVLTPIHHEDAGHYYSVVEALNHFGFEICELNDSEATEKDYQIASFNWATPEKLQDFTVQTLLCLQKRSLRR